MCKMSSKAVKILVALIVLGVAGVISLAVYFGTAQASASVDLQGDHAQSKLAQSAGIHVLEITNQGDSSGCNSWTVSEYAVVMLSFIVLLKCTHLLHYFYCTRRQVKKSVLKERERAKTDQDKLGLVPVDRVLVPAI